MDELKERILKNGRIIGSDTLKVDSFLNQQIDINLLHAMGEEFYRLFKEDGINKILTVESSGISIACAAAQFFNVSVVFAKKGITKTLDRAVYETEIKSFTKGIVFNVSVDKDYITKDDKILIIDDFLASGEAVFGLMDIISQAGAELKGVGIVIEKGFQEGGKILRERGIKLESLAVIDSFNNGSVVFKK